MSTEHLEPAPPPHPADPAPTPAPRVTDVAPAGASQGTVIEQTRAVAVVVAQVQAARACPRDPDIAVERMREVCDQLAVAERAFYRYKRGKTPVTGPSVHLMDELARCWQNIDHGMAELRRDVPGGYSEAKVWAWDMESNYRAEQSFIVPHLRDTKDGPAPLKELRDIYELVTNQSRRRVRESIRRVLPAWFVDEAIDRCTTTLQTGGKNAKPLPQRIADAVALFDALGVRVGQLERKLGHQRKEWTPFDVAELAVSYRTIRQGDASVDDEFPKEAVTGDEIRAQHAELAAGGQAPRSDGDPEPVPTPPAEYDDNGVLLDPERPM